MQGRDFMAVHSQNPIEFGTDGWRGVIAADFTFDRVALVAPIAAQVLAQVYGDTVPNNTVIVGHDRRFMAEDFARTAAEAIAAAGFDVLLTETYAPTPAFSWAAKENNALGAIVITASHNPGTYLGLKVKGAFGGSVPPEVTKQIEARLHEEPPVVARPGTIAKFNPWSSYCEVLKSKVDIGLLESAITEGKLTVFADVMHGAAAGGLSQIIGAPIREINSDRDPLFGGGAPEPLPRYLSGLFSLMQNHERAVSPGSAACAARTQRDRTTQETPHGDLVVGLVFDGDCDRIAAVDGQGNFLSSQFLIPILIGHLAARRRFTGEVIKTISGSDLIPRVASLYDLPVHETAIGFKYIADRMLSTQVLIGGEESGGIGYSTHIPERDALLSALYVLEAVGQSGEDLSALYRQLQQETGYTSAYDRIDLPLASMEVRSRIFAQLQANPLTEIAGKSVVDCNGVDGYKFRLVDGSWLLVRFSGTEPLLRLYCEAATLPQVHQTLEWAKVWVNSIG